MTERMARPGGWVLLKRHRAAWLSLWVLGALAVVAILGPMLLPEAVRQTSPNTYLPPLSRVMAADGESSEFYLFGTDINGKGLFYRVLAGARISLGIGLAAACISLFLGTAYGIIAGYSGGRIDSLMMRVVDVLYSIPRILFIMIFIAAFDPALRAGIDGLRNWAGKSEMEWLEGMLGDAIPYSRILILVVSLGLIEWLTMARIVRGQVLVLREQQYVTAARAMGQSHGKIMRMHLLPNLWTVILTYLTLTVPAVILDETFLSFLGLGIDDPAASWGSLLKDGAQVINPVDSKWWLLVFPATFLAVALMALNFLGDGLRDVFDPRSQH
jgi:oligopeptide transport system permease protein